jgi:hypothetical protein
MESAEALNMVHQDLALAQHLGLRSIPSVIAPGLPTLQTLPLGQLRERLRPGGLSHLALLSYPRRKAHRFRKHP